MERVAIESTGVGAFDLVAIPVAVLHNQATHHGAAQVVVHFATTRSGARLGSLDSVPVNLGPGETLAVTADCTDACTGASSATATVSVGAWVDAPGVTLSAGPAAYRCETCRPGRGHGDVTGTVRVGHLGLGAAVVLFAMCANGGGGIIGGGSVPAVWPGTTSLAVDVPVLVSARPARCSLGASTGW